MISNYKALQWFSPQAYASLLASNMDCCRCEYLFGEKPCLEKSCDDFWLEWINKDYNYNEMLRLLYGEEELGKRIRYS